MEYRSSAITRSFECCFTPSDSYGAATNISNYDRLNLDINKLSQHVTNPKIVAPVSDILGDDVFMLAYGFFLNTGDEGTDWHQADTFANASEKPQILWLWRN
ncbi:phytanoyl-CoA dioxygenase family protein [Enterobacter cloacae subsp. cloacae]|nr:phytanoyl-CoA dioxygenase family protein [Enterobacter cloacae subsp. cloacae]